VVRGERPSSLSSLLFLLEEHLNLHVYERVNSSVVLPLHDARKHTA
jgi:hypothetical protein